MKFLASLLLLGSFCLTSMASPLIGVNIIGGSPARQGQFPHQVTIIKRSALGAKHHHCGGVIVDPSFVLTTAACVKGQSLSPLFVRAGEINFTVSSPYEQEVKPSRLIPHPLYDEKRNLNDIALVELETPFDLDKVNVNAIKLPKVDSDVSPGEECVLSGFGTEKEGDGSSAVLRFVYVPSLSDSECLTSYPNEIDETMLCAGFMVGGVGSCEGDFGGPISCGDVHDTLHGISSWGTGCGRPGLPEVNTQASYFVPWIQEQLEQARTRTTQTTH